MKSLRSHNIELISAILLNTTFKDYRNLKDALIKHLCFDEDEIIFEKPIEDTDDIIIVPLTINHIDSKLSYILKFKKFKENGKEIVIPSFIKNANGDLRIEKRKKITKEPMCFIFSSIE